jgi:hemoglobin
MQLLNQKVPLASPFKSLLCAASFAALLSISACQSIQENLYHELGGEAKIAQITNNLLEEISFNPHIVPYFKNSNIERFREKLNEHLCAVTDGPCVYTGDSMLMVHKGMNINENHFNLMVELLINAMTTASIEHSTQNKVLARLAPMRTKIMTP